MDESVMALEAKIAEQCRYCYVQQKITTAVCVFTCVFAFSCCVYCTWIAQVSSCHGDVEQGLHVSKKTLISTPSRTSNQNLQDIETLTYRRAKRSSGTKKSARKARKPKTRAAHYITNAVAHYQVLPGYQHNKLAKPCANISAMDGELCRDESFIPHGEQLHIFTEASWVDRKRSPFKRLKDGSFEAKYTGIYLVYGQLLALDIGDNRNINLKQTRGNSEIQSVSCFESFKTFNDSSRFKTCGIMALFSAKKKDKFIIQNLSSKSTALSLRAGANYIGAVVLK